MAYDFLMVGGGVIGLSIAYDLAQHGGKVGVLESRKRCGSAASWAAVGILPPANSATAIDPYAKLMAASYDLYPTWAAALQNETGLDPGLRKCGGIYFAREIGEAASLRALQSQFQEEQIAIAQIDPQDIAQYEPALEPLATSGTVKSLYHIPDEYQLRNPDLVETLVAACRSRGVDLLPNQHVEEVQITDHSIRSVVTADGQKHVAKQYCVTAGPWTQSLLKQCDVASGILPIRGQVVLFQLPKRVFSHVINEGYRYLVPRDDGHVLVGSTLEEAGFDESTTPAAIESLTTFAGEIIPDLTRDRVVQSWAGLRPGTLDGFPYLGRIPDLQNGYVAAGHYRAGLYLAPITGHVMSCLLRDEPVELDLRPFRPGRG